MTYTALFAELVRAEIDLWDSLESHLTSDLGITVARYQALSAIASFEGVARVQDVSQEMFITVGATSKLVDRLERDRLAIRGSNPTDRRSSIITLTPTGREKLAAATLAVESHLSTVLGDTYTLDRAARLTGDLVELRASADVEVSDE